MSHPQTSIVTDTCFFQIVLTVATMAGQDIGERTDVVVAAEAEDATNDTEIIEEDEILERCATEEILIRIQ